MSSPSLSSRGSNSNNDNNDTLSQRHSWNQARHDFRKAVQTAVDDLVQQQGFSRAHATKTVVQYMARDTTTTTGNTINTLPPSDAEVFAFMQQYGLGSQQAVLAMAVSSLMKEKYATGGLSDMEMGLRKLTELVRGIPDAEPTPFQTEDDPTTITNISLPLLKLTKNQGNDSTLLKEQKARITAASSSHNRTKQPTKNHLPSRKRAAVNEVVDQEQQSKRLRANSLSEEVHAKVEEAEATAVTTRSTVTSDAKKVAVVVKAATPTPTVRSKRTRNTSITTSMEQTDHVPSTVVGTAAGATTTTVSGKRRK